MRHAELLEAAIAAAMPSMDLQPWRAATAPHLHMVAQAAGTQGPAAMAR